MSRTEEFVRELRKNMGNADWDSFCKCVLDEMCYDKDATVRAKATSLWQTMHDEGVDE